MKNIKSLIRKKQDILDIKESTNEELTKTDKLAKKVNSITLKLLGISSILILPALLYFIPVLPKSAPLSLIMNLAFIGVPLGLMSGITLAASNLLYFIPVKMFGKHYNNKLEQEQKNIDKQIKRIEAQNNTNNNKNTNSNTNNNTNKNKKATKMKYSYNATKKKEPEKEIKIVNGKPKYVNKEKSQKIAPNTKIIFKNGMPCYVSEETNEKVKKRKIRK